MYSDPTSNSGNPLSPLEQAFMSSSSGSMSADDKKKFLQDMAQGSGALARAIQRMLEDPSVKAELGGDSTYSMAPKGPSDMKAYDSGFGTFTF